MRLYSFKKPCKRFGTCTGCERISGVEFCRREWDNTDSRLIFEEHSGEDGLHVLITVYWIPKEAAPDKLFGRLSMWFQSVLGL